MAGSENDGSNKQVTGNDVQKEASIYEDEINLIDYFLVLWKRKWFIFVASVLPPLVVGLAIFIGPRDYKISYTYDMGLGEKAFKTLEDKFYSTENLEKLAEKLQANGFNEYAKRLAGAGTEEGLRKFVTFEISPSYFEAIKPSKAKDLDELEKFQQVKGTLLVMRVGAKSEENIREIASVCRNNFEQIIPLYSEREELNNKIISFKERMAAIEEARYMLNLELERKKSTLEKLKNSGSEGLDKLPSDVILQFNNVGGNSAYLPLPYQIQAAETQLINLEEQIRANKEKYDYSVGLLKLNEKLFSYVKKVMPFYYTLEQFHSFLTNTLAEYNENEQQLLDYLKAYIKRIENKIANVIPLVERPKVYPLAKGTVKKSAIVFVVALMISVFAAFLLEGLKKSQAQTS
ncbi:MAG: hypothetical protein IIC00_11625 [Planctomycetes bacterium]|nr:hypothetical protein [Planctomycetota bacterium]